MRTKKQVIWIIGIVLFCLVLTGCGVFGSAKKKKCLPCSSKRRSAIEQKTVKSYQTALLQDIRIKHQSGFNS